MLFTLTLPVRGELQVIGLLLLVPPLLLVAGAQLRLLRLFHL